MPTDNPKISTYVPPAVYERFKSFQQERGLSMSQAAIVIFAEYFGIEETVEGSARGTTVGGVTLESLEALREQIEALSARVEHLESTEKPPIAKSSTEKSSLQLGLLSESQDTIQPISGQTLSQVRFALGKSTVAGAKKSRSAEEFAEWTRQHDPDGIAWKPVEKPKKGYVPANELSGELESRLLTWVRESLS